MAAIEAFFKGDFDNAITLAGAAGVRAELVLDGGEANPGGFQDFCASGVDANFIVALNRPASIQSLVAGTLVPYPLT